ncbi:MAG: flagellar hook-associated protein FlgK [Halieaceae bacterium]|nr:flagellar hook-associated protein FlgK [Halieaceae bacterium]
MVDTLAIGSGAINAYRQALSTTSNNIANVNTPGYSRRALSIGESFPVQEGIFSFGTGAQSEAITRAYDEFLERSLRDAKSDLAVNEPVIQYANRVIDIMANESASLANAMEDFFNAAEQLSTDPRSNPLRNDFLSSGELIAVRFNDLSLQIENIAEEAEISFRQSVDDLNALSVQLLRINKQLNRASDVDKQPPTLLDQRDAILREMSQLAKLGVTELPNGQVIVNFGGSGRGFEIVTPTESKAIGVFATSEAAGSDLRLILDPYGAKRPMPSSPSGAIGGAVALNTEILRPIRSGLDHLARTFAAEANDIHRRGLDARGEFGGDLFRSSAEFKATLDTANGAISASAKVVDPSVAPTEALELIYKESSNTWDVLDLMTRERLGQISLGEKQELQGMSFSMTGAPENGDVVIFSPVERPSRTFEMLVKDVDRVAVSAAMRTSPGAANTSGVEAALSVIAEDQRPQGFEFGYALSSNADKVTRADISIAADGMRPAVQIARGTQGAEVAFDIAATGDQHIQVLTREGILVAGTETLTSSAANNLMSLDSGFGAGGYSTTYRNQSGTAAYLDTEIKFGAQSKTQEVTRKSIDPDTGILNDSTVTVPALFVSKPVSPTAVTADLMTAGAINFNHSYYDPSDASADSDGYVEAEIALESLSLSRLGLSSGERVSAAAMAQYFNGQFDRLSNANVNATAQNTLMSGEFDPSKSLTINSVTVNHAANAKINEMIQAINGVSGQTGVRAEWRAESGLALTNTAGNEGDNITLGVSGSDTVTALGLTAGTYAGTYSIAAAGEEKVSNTFASATEVLNAGSAFTLTVTRAGVASTVSVNAGSDTPQGIVDAINAASGSTSVSATLVSDSGGQRISLHNTSGVTSDFTVSSDITGYTQVDSQGNTVVDTDLGFEDLNNRNLGLNKPTEIGLTISSSGTPADLGRLGFATEVIIDGPAADDYAVFLTGTGSVDTALRADKASGQAASQYPADSFVINFSSASVYTITDTATSTVVATRNYTAGDSISYQGIQVNFDDIPSSGDSYTIEPNADGVGNNENMLDLIQLSKEPLISGQTFTAAYRDLVAGTGSRAHLAELSRDAMTVVYDQAEASREAAVGVNLDEEAADLIRFQQAYQAAAQVIQVSQRMFDTLIQLG